jgi:hypothetical protein
MGRVRRFLVVLVTIAACELLAGCTTTPAGPGATTGNAAATSSPAAMTSCTVITRTEAGAALAQTVTAPVEGNATVEGGVACVFYGPSAPTNANPDVPVADSVRVVLVTGAQASRFFNDYRSKVPAQSVFGLGQQAFWDGSASLSVLQGSDYLRIAVVGVTDTENAEKALAADALQRF